MSPGHHRQSGSALPWLKPAAFIGAGGLLLAAAVLVPLTRDDHWEPPVAAPILDVTLPANPDAASPGSPTPDAATQIVLAAKTTRSATTPVAYAISDGSTRPTSPSTVAAGSIEPATQTTGATTPTTRPPTPVTPPSPPAPENPPTTPAKEPTSPPATTKADPVTQVVASTLTTVGGTVTAVVAGTSTTLNGVVGALSGGVRN